LCSYFRDLMEIWAVLSGDKKLFSNRLSVLNHG
jgi:hypothetical protein